MKYLIVCLLLCAGLFSCTQEELHSPMGGAGITPQPPSDVDVDNRNGKSIIYYSIEDDHTLYVLAEYTSRQNGKTRQVKSSNTRNSLVVDGFAEAGEYEVTLYAVSEDELRSTPVKVTIHPDTPPYVLAFNSLEAISGFGGVNLKAENEFSEDFVFEILVKNAKDEWENWDSFQTKLPQVKYTSSDLELSEYEMGFYVRDRWQNLSDTLVKILRPLQEVKINVNQGGYAHYSLPTDIPNSSPPLASNAWGFDKLFDGSFGTSTGNVFFKNGPTVMPFHFTVDLKNVYSLSKVKVFQRTTAHGGGTPYSGANVKKFRIWGSTNPNPDGSFDASWTLLGDFENIKPSGIPIVGTNSSLDVETADAGEIYFFDPDGVLATQPVRYLRFQLLENWAGTSTMHMAELEVYGAGT